ncbi:MAG: isopentenyl-diphosphate Delta-isomerase [Flavobacteriales bacterium]|nr:isopentenyl-diphosphate Delta-isomerase [Flavobacteriales bacterium]
MKAGEVILVNTRDEELGTMEKMEAHTTGSLHRAFSVFVFNTKGEMLIHRRAADKYHSAGLWTNACCSHPSPGESLQEAVKRRLMEEIGMNCKADYLFNFTYREELENNLIEHELDHVFKAITDDIPQPNPAEISEVKYISPENLLTDIAQHPENYTVWFKLIVAQVIELHKEELKV